LEIIYSHPFVQKVCLPPAQADFPNFSQEFFLLSFSKPAFFMHFPLFLVGICNTQGAISFFSGSLCALFPTSRTGLSIHIKKRSRLFFNPCQLKSGFDHLQYVGNFGGKSRWRLSVSRLGDNERW
jgi:hypothetical protein